MIGTLFGDRRAMFFCAVLSLVRRVFLCGILGCERYKLLRFDGEEEFYDLQNDPFEHENLLVGELSADQQAEYLTLQEQIATLRSSE